jgi:hypothetical protein
MKLKKKNIGFFKNKKKHYLTGTERPEQNRNIPGRIWMEFPEHAKILSEIKYVLI